MRYNSFDFCDCRLIKQHGRCGFEDGALAMSWSNSGIEFNFEGTGFIVSFRHYAGETPAYVRVFVDGVSQRFAIANGEERICYDGLAEGRHNVKILRITEGLKLLLIDSVTLCGDDPSLLDRPAVIQSPADTALWVTMRRPDMLRSSRTAQTRMRI